MTNFTPVKYSQLIMTTKKRQLLALLLMLLLVVGAFAQSKSELEDIAYDHLSNFEYAKAYDAFEKLNTRYPKEMDYQFKLGVCALSVPEKRERAIEIFQTVNQKIKTKESQFYLAKAYHSNYKFDEALATLQPMSDELSKSKKKEDLATLKDVKLLISNCNNAKELVKDRMPGEIKNIGSPINTNEVEGVPIITADESIMMYTYIGKKSMGGKVNASLESDKNGIYTSDIYFSVANSDTSWSKPEPLKSLNTKGFDAAIALSPDGTTLFTYLSDEENGGDIMVSKLNGKEFSKPEPLNENINTKEYWEGSCAISSDGKTLYFVSERPGGFGGRDIYKSELINGDWGPAVNLGPSINTEHFEDSPFIHPNGITLFFSSQGHTSMGGYDIMYSSLQDGVWTTPKNMGVPLNTVEDDRYYVINSKGDKGYFSSDRVGGFGNQDIYMVNPGVVGERIIVALFKGVIYGDNRPIVGKIDLTRVDNNETVGQYLSNGETGRYLLTCRPGFSYKLKVSGEGFNTFEEELDLETMVEYVERTKDFFLYSKTFMETSPTMVKVNDNTKFVPPPPSTPTLAVVDPIKTETKEEPKQPTKEEPKQETIATKEPVVVPEKEKVKEKEVVAVVEEKKKETAKPKKEPKKVEPKKEEPIVAKEPTPGPCSSELPSLASLKGKSLNDVSVYKEMLSIAGNYCSADIEFKVQIGAYRKPENYKYSNLKNLGAVNSEAYPDGITRFTQKQFTTINEAEKHRQKAIAKGTSDAWIVAFVNGKRYTLEELIMADFLGKAIN